MKTIELTKDEVGIIHQILYQEFLTISVSNEVLSMKDDSSELRDILLKLEVFNIEEPVIVIQRDGDSGGAPLRGQKDTSLVEPESEVFLKDSYNDLTKTMKSEKESK